MNKNNYYDNDYKNIYNKKKHETYVESNNLYKQFYYS